MTDLSPDNGPALMFELLATAAVVIELDVDGVRRESRSVSSGEQLTVRVEREIAMTLSDAGAVQLRINGRPAGSLGLSGEPRTVRIGRHNWETFLTSP